MFKIEARVKHSSGLCICGSIPICAFYINFRNLKVGDIMSPSPTLTGQDDPVWIQLRYLYKYVLQLIKRHHCEWTVSPSYLVISGSGLQYLPKVTQTREENVWEPWSSGYGRWLMIERSWVQIPAPYTVWNWHFLTLICCKNCIAVCLKRPKIKEKDAGVRPFFKKIREGRTSLEMNFIVPQKTASMTEFIEKWLLIRRIIVIIATPVVTCVSYSGTRLGDLLDFWQLNKAFGNN